MNKTKCVVLLISAAVITASCIQKGPPQGPEEKPEAVTVETAEAPAAETVDDKPAVPEEVKPLPEPPAPEPTQAEESLRFGGGRDARRMLYPINLLGEANA